LSYFKKYNLVVGVFDDMVNMDGPRKGRISVYSNSLNEVTLSMVCEEILSSGKLVTANWPQYCTDRQKSVLRNLTL